MIKVFRYLCKYFKQIYNLDFFQPFYYIMSFVLLNSNFSFLTILLNKKVFYLKLNFYTFFKYLLYFTLKKNNNDNVIIVTKQTYCKLNN